MKILQVCPRFAPYRGGIESHVEAISKALAKMGIEIQIYTTDPTGRLSPRETIDGLEIFRFHSYSLGDLYLFSPMLLMALKHLNNVDVVHAHDYQDYCVLAAVQAKGAFNSPLVITPHYHPIGANMWRTVTKRIYTTGIGKYALRAADVVIAVSQYEKTMLSQSFSLDSKRIVHIPNGVNSKFRSLNTRDAKKKRNVLYVGRLEKYKGVQFLIKAFKKLAEDFQDSHLMIVGNGSYRKDLVTLAKALGIGGRVTFAGLVPENELINLYLTSNVFVMPSEYEAFSIALAEAMACGTPVIATKVGGMTELVRNSQSGFLMPYPPDERYLADLMAGVLSDPTNAEKMGEKGRQFALSNFNWSLIAEDLLKLYKGVSA
jgi:glycosyltransferase involved in cell wall biosynthesis